MKFLNKYFIRLKNNSFIKSVAALSTGQIISLSINILSTPLLSRIYPKESFGEFAIVVSSAIIIIGIIGLGLGSAIMVPKTNEESEDIIVTVYTIQFFLATILMVILLLISPYYQVFNLSIPYYIGIILMYIYILSTTLSNLMMVYINKLKKNKALLVNSLIGVISLLLFKIPFGLLKLDFIGLFSATILSSVIVNVHMLRITNPFKRRFTLNKTIQIFKTYKSFVLYQYPSNLINQFTSQFPKQYIGNNYGSINLADLDMSNKVIQQPLSLIASPTQTIYFRTASEKFKNGEDIADFTYCIVKIAMILGSLPILLLVLFGEPIFGFVLGKQWTDSGKIASIMALSYLFTFIYGCITYARVIMNKQKSNLISTILNFIITVCLLIIANLIFGTFISIIYAYAVASIIFNVMNIFITLKILNKNYIKFISFTSVYILIVGTIILIKYFI